MATPPLSTALGELKKCFAKYTDLRVLRHCLGIDPITTVPTQNIDVARIRAIADQIIDHTIVVCIDTEHWTFNSDEMTEIGLAVIRNEDVSLIAQTKTFGDHGFNIMEQAKFHFFRLREKSHLGTTNENSRGPEGNSFGEARFVTFDEARTILRDLLVQPINNVNGLRGHDHPIVILGHSIGHDRQHLNGKDLAFDLDGLGTVVRYIDTQKITRDANFWHDPRENPIGLRDLVKKLEFEHTNSHTAANDAARTLVAGILMAIPREARQGCRRNTQKVLYDLEASSRANFEPLGGVEQYCCRCGSVGHLDEPRCLWKGPMRCEECVSRGLDVFAQSHISLHCNIVRDEVSEERLTWYADQPKEWKPKYPFSSRDRLQAFSPNASRVTPPTNEEIVARRKWYDDQKGSPNPLIYFVWEGRRFKNSALYGLGPPLPQKPRREGFRTPLWPDSKLPNYTPPTRPAVSYGSTNFNPLNLNNDSTGVHGLPPLPPPGAQYNGPPPGFQRLAVQAPLGPPGLGHGSSQYGRPSGPPPGLNYLPPPPAPPPGRPFVFQPGSGWGGSNNGSLGGGQG